MTPSLARLYSSTVVLVRLHLRNQVVVEYTSPTLTAASLGYEFLDLPRVVTLALHAGNTILDDIAQANYRGGMYAVDGAVRDVENDILRIALRVTLAQLSGNKREATTGATLRDTDADPAETQVEAVQLGRQLLRNICDSLGGGEYWEPRESP